MTATLRKQTAGIKRAKLAAGPTIGAGYARGLVNFAVSKGAGRAALLKAAGIAADEIEDLDQRVELSRYETLLRAGADLTGEPALALQFGEAVRMQEISIVGLICEACETTVDVGVQLNRYGRLAFDVRSDVEPIRLVHDADGYWMDFAGAVFNGNPMLAEAELARMVENARTMFADNAYFRSTPFPLAVQVKHEAPSYRGEYERIFRAPVRFGAKMNALQIDPGFLSLRQPPVSRYVFGVLSARAEALLRELEETKTLRGQVESLLIPVLHTGVPPIEQIAAKVGVSRATLYRKLKAEGASFEKVLDDLRHRMALHYLDGKQVSVNEAAYLVGFSEPSAFSRAFRRWTGTSPAKRARR
ncbi:MAG: AraC family transcriptional regulator ligand-binding domain-containing protein [Alphaproteobacteria bacterium]|nr:AraC family transcriptional regulator ligand-binding domain-containing protein [Alphaproteobacteria bacterium]